MDTGPILIKLTGELLHDRARNSFTAHHFIQLIPALDILRTTRGVALVIGGGNIFRGSIQGKQLALSTSTGHQLGMLATVMNGMILQDLLACHAIPATVLNSFAISGLHVISPQNIRDAQTQKHIIIFTGGTGAPYFTTDTAAVVRAIQCGAHSIWKATTIDGIYDADPRVITSAQLLKTITHQQAITQRLGFMDMTALVLAQEHQLAIRVFNIMQEYALHEAISDPTFGSTVIDMKGNFNVSQC